MLLLRTRKVGGVPADTGRRVLLLTWTVGCSYTRGVAADDMENRGVPPNIGRRVLLLV